MTDDNLSLLMMGKKTGDEMKIATSNSEKLKREGTTPLVQVSLLVQLSETVLCQVNHSCFYITFQPL